MDCKTWLTLCLSDRQIHLSEETAEKARKAGYSRVELKKARRELGVKTFHQFDEFGGDTRNWFWYLEV